VFSNAFFDVVKNGNAFQKISLRI